MGDGIFSKLKVLVGIEEVEEDDDDLEEEVISVPKSLERRPMEVRSSYSQPRAESRDSRESKENRVVAMQQSRNTGQFKMIVIEPKSFDDCPKLVDNLKSRRPVIINLEKIESDTARKIFDFLSGATYALDGNVQKIANNIFVFAPDNVDVSSSVDQKGAGFSDGIKNPWR